VMLHIGVFLLWLLHFLPSPALARLGAVLGELAFWVARDRREVALVNLRLCFPHLDEAGRRAIAHAHFHAFGRALLEESLLWWSSKARLRRLIRIEGQEHWEAVRSGKVIIMTMHMVGLNMGAFRIGLDSGIVALYTKVKDRRVDALLQRYRRRFGTATLVSRQESLRTVLRALKPGVPLYVLPDQDFGPRDSIFVPFFGVPAATIPSVSRLAGIAGAVVLPCCTVQRPGGRGYVLRFFPAWQDFPSGDIERDTRRMNAFIEECVLETPAQYFWTHKRFKTRPPGEPSFYRSRRARD